MESTNAIVPKPEGVVAPIVTPGENDIASMTHAIVEWRRLTEEVRELRQSAREKNKKMKALEEVILRVMKNHNIGALDLKTSGSRVLFKKSKRKAGIGGKNLLKHLTDFFKSEQKANEAIKFIDEHREVTTKESLLLEKVDV